MGIYASFLTQWKVTERPVRDSNHGSKQRSGCTRKPCPVFACLASDVATIGNGPVVRYATLTRPMLLAYLARI
ncbi:hypothetical protein IEO21_02608 [Rhodonia placenta]|uniref:Uncharacterized protein n=1 Tax=Rhodonia placenta TaxID=104341 RepID=A0A8H7U471_9APHY|nr:hypothetical protein IEO21_02608 [Postia placenta]